MNGKRNVNDKNPKFVVDGMLGKLAKWLRILGFDTEYKHLRNADQIQEYLNKGKIVITKNQKWNPIDGIICLKSNHWENQLTELSQLITLFIDDNKVLSRCLRCNTELVKVDRQKAYGHVPDYILDTVDEFSMCSSCGKFFWTGSHISRMEEKINGLKRMLRRGMKDESKGRKS